MPRLGRSDRARQAAARDAQATRVAVLMGAASGVAATQSAGATLDATLADVEAAVVATHAKLDGLDTKAGLTNSKLDTANGHLAAIETNTAGP